MKLFYLVAISFTPMLLILITEIILSVSMKNDVLALFAEEDLAHEYLLILFCDW